MKRLLYIDDDKASLGRMERHVRERYPFIEPVMCSNPVEALGLIDRSLDLLVVDLEMPVIDGKKILSFAIACGLDSKRIIILSGRDADHLHKVIPMGACLCVLNKQDQKQLDVLDMVLASLEKK